MTEPKHEDGRNEAFRPRPDESSLEWTRRTLALVEEGLGTEEERRLYSPLRMLPGESTEEFFRRQRELTERDKIEDAARERRREQAKKKADTSQERKGGMSAAEESTRGLRIKSQERDAERAIANFEESKKRLCRTDGSKVYGEAEHVERLQALTSELSEKVEQIITEAQEDAQGYEREALGLSYTDPTKGLTVSELDRLSASLPLIREDCEAMLPPALIERLRAVCAGSDKVAKVLHARYARSRAEAMDTKMAQTARSGASVSAEDAAALRGLREAVSELEGQLEDEDTAKRREAAREAAKKSRQLAAKLRRRRSEADGSDERARQEYLQSMRSTI